MKLIKDLGMIRVSKTNTAIYGLYECPICKKHFKTKTNLVNKGMSTKCRSCANRISASARKHKHGDWKARLYSIYNNMKARCTNENAPTYKYYGGKGVTICDEWMSDYLLFKEWALNNGYKDDLTIDRIDSNGCYEPNNCRWATMAEQSKNKCNSRAYTAYGETKSLMEWSKFYDIPHSTLFMRMKRGRTFIEALEVSGRYSLDNGGLR